MQEKEGDQNIDRPLPGKLFGLESQERNSLREGDPVQFQGFAITLARSSDGEIRYLKIVSRSSAVKDIDAKRHFLTNRDPRKSLTSVKKVWREN